MCRTAGPTLAGSLDSLAKLGQLSLFYRYYSVWYSFRFAELFNKLIEYRSLFLREVYSLFWKSFPSPSLDVPRMSTTSVFFSSVILCLRSLPLTYDQTKSKLNSYISFWALLNRFSLFFFCSLSAFSLNTKSCSSWLALYETNSIYKNIRKHWNIGGNGYHKG